MAFLTPSSSAQGETDRHDQDGPEITSSLVRFPGAARHRVFCESLVVHGALPAIYHRPLELEVIGALRHSGHSSMARGVCTELFDNHPNFQNQSSSGLNAAHVANIDIKAPPSESADSSLWEQTTSRLRDIGWSVREECSTAALYAGDPTLDLPMFGPVRFVRVRWPLHGRPGQYPECDALPLYDARGKRSALALADLHNGMRARVRFTVACLPYSGGPVQGLLVARLTAIHSL